MVKVIKYTVKTNTRVDQAKMIMSIHCLLNGIRLSDTELTILAYFIVYGYSTNTKKLILNSKIFNSLNALDNSISKLRNFGFIEKKGSKSFLSSKINFVVEPIMGVMIKLDNLNNI